MAGSLNGKVALVTGGSSGIGRATALAFGRAGAKVAIADIDADGGQQTVQSVEANGGTALFVEANVTRPSDMEAMLDKIVRAWGSLDIAFNNAGGSRGPRVPTHEYLDEDWDWVVDVNLKGVWQCMKHEIPQMLRQGHGAIVNMSSIMGLVAAPDLVAYVAAKHGVVGLTKAAALEYAQKGIRVNAVCPGYISTQRVLHRLALYPNLKESIIEKEPMGRMGTAEEVARTVVWLCSDAASFVTGHAMGVDGGYVAQ